MMQKEKFIKTFCICIISPIYIPDIYILLCSSRCVTLFSSSFLMICFPLFLGLLMMLLHMMMRWKAEQRSIVNNTAKCNMTDSMHRNDILSVLNGAFGTIDSTTWMPPSRKLLVFFSSTFTGMNSECYTIKLSDTTMQLSGIFRYSR
jgi:hypothetical protein